MNRAVVSFLATLAMAAGLVVWTIMRVENQAADGHERVGWQDADTPPSGGPLADPRLDPPDAWRIAEHPLAVAAGPVVAERAAAGAEVLAAADGIVLFAGPRDGALAVVLGHRAPDGGRFETTYAPLAATSLRAGGLVGRGLRVGTLGESPLLPVTAGFPEGIEQVAGGRSALAEALESRDDAAWQSLEIGNAARLLELEGAEPER